MKNIFRFMFLSAAAAMLTVGCEKREAFDGAMDGGSAAGDEVGYVVFSENGLTVEFEGERVSDTEQGSPETRAGETPNKNDFTVEIINAATNEPMPVKVNGSSNEVTSFKYGQRGTLPIALPRGTYYVRVYSGKQYELVGTAFWQGDGQGQPAWTGRSDAFNISKEYTFNSPQTIGTITCTMQTVKITVALEKALANRFAAAKTEITVAISDDDRYDSTNPKNHSVVYKNTGHPYGLVELGDDKRSIVKTERESDISYLATVTTDYNSLFVNVKTQYTDIEGSSRNIEIPLTIASAGEQGVMPGQWRRITLYLDSIDEDTGRIVIGASIETWVYNEEVKVDVKDAVANLGERTIKDVAPEILRLYSDDFNLKDGNVNEINNYGSDQQYAGSARIGIFNLEPLERFSVCISTQNNSFASILNSLNMNDVWVNMMDTSNNSQTGARSQLNMWGFPRQGALVEAGTDGMTFDIKGLLSYLYTYPGRHDVGIALVAGDYYYRADLNLDVVLGAGPGGDSGDAPRIEWVGYNIKQKYNLNDVSDCKVNVYAPGRIEKFMVSISGRIADPELGLLEDVHIPEEFDLCDPDAYDPGGGDNPLSTTLFNLGFPVGQDVKGKTSLVDKFDITLFLNVIKEVAAGGESDFTLTVTDANGQTTSETLQFIAD